MEERATVLISGRFSDWDFIADCAAVEEWLAMPVPLPPPDPADHHHNLIRDTLSHRQPEKPADPPDPVQVVLMEPLDEHRIRRFAGNAGVSKPPDSGKPLGYENRGNLS